MNARTPITAARAADLELWTGRPDARAAAWRIWKLGWAGAWFALLLADGAWLATRGRHAPPQAWTGEARLAVGALAVLAGLCLLAWLTARTTRYAIGARAVTLRYGVALPATLVIPYAAIAHVAVRIHGDGTGDVALRLKPGPRVIYPKLWPHARPWRWTRPEPMLRCVPDAGAAAALLCRALAAQPPAAG